MGFLCLAALVFLAYANTLHSPLVFDDIPNIVENAAIRLQRIDGPGLWRAAFDSPHATRPVANLSFALNYRIHGLKVTGYHLVNLFVHLATGWVFCLLALETLGMLSPASVAETEDRRRHHRLVALTAAALWMLHPLQTQSVTYIVQRMNSLATLFYLISVWCYVRGRRQARPGRRTAAYAAAILSGLMAAGSKEIAVTLPLFLFLYEWFFFQNADRRWLLRRWPWIVAMAVMGAAVCRIYLGDDPLGRILGSYTHRAYTPAERLLTQPRVIFFYLSLLAWPHPSRLNLDHHMTLSHAWTAPPTTLVAMSALAALCLALPAVTRRNRLLGFALVWYLGNLGIESSVIGLELVFEHRNYLPSLFLFLALADAAGRILPRSTLRVLLAAAVILVLGLWTLERNQVWRSDLTLWRDCAVKSPDKPRPHNKLGVALERRGRLAEAEAAFRHVIALDPAHPYAYFNLANTLARQGRAEEAVDDYQKSLVLVPENAGARVNLGVLLTRMGRTEAALESFSRVGADQGTFYAMARKNMGVLFMAAGKWDEARERFQEALTADPRDSDLWMGIGDAWAQAGQPARAAEAFRAALGVAPQRADIRRRLAAVLKAQERFGDNDAGFR